MKYLNRYLVFIALFLSAGLLSAAPHQKITAPELVIHKIYVDIQNLSNVNKAVVLAHVKLREGMQYDTAMADRSIRSMYDSGLFEYAKVGIRQIEGEGVDVVFTVFPKFRISEILIEGNKKLKLKKLNKELTIKPGTPLDEGAVKSDLDKLNKLYEKKGFYDAKVKYVIDKNTDTGLAKITFTVDEGFKRRVRQVTFLGNEHVKSGALQGLIKTRKWHMFSWFTGSGYVKDEVFSEDIEKIKKYYRDQGYLDIEIKDSDIEFDYPNDDSVKVAIHVHEGKQYYAGSVSIEGNTLYSTQLLQKQIKLKPGDILSAAVVDDDTETLKNYFGQFGYLETYVVAERKSNLETDAIDVTYRVKESDKYYVNSIVLQGNTNTKSVVVVRELALAPGDVFDLVRMKNSEARLNNTRFFETVNVTAESTNIPNKKNLKISLKEGRTGNLSFGGGMSSIESFMIFVELSQTNFDLFSYKTFFRGGGQKFRLRFSLGELSHEVVLAFEEPWLFQHELAVGLELFHSSSDFQSKFYKELHTGLEVYMRRWFWEMIEGRVSYNIQRVTFSDVSKDAPQRIKDEEGNRTISKYGLSLIYDTRDSFLYPTEGERIQLNSEIAGSVAGGPTRFYRFALRSAKWFPTFDTQNQVWSFFFRAATVDSYSGQELPFFERLFLGGPDSLRGLNYRGAGPKFSNGEPRGGKSTLYGGSEYSFDLFHPVRGVLFYDIGTVNLKPWRFSNRTYSHDVGFGFRIFILGAPLKLDFATPLKAPNQKSGGLKVHWSFDTTF